MDGDTGRWAGAWLLGTCRHPLCSLSKAESKAGAEAQEQEEVRLREAKLGHSGAQVCTVLCRISGRHQGRWGRG